MVCSQLRSLLYVDESARLVEHEVAVVAAQHAIDAALLVDFDSGA